MQHYIPIIDERQNGKLTRTTLPACDTLPEAVQARADYMAGAVIPDCKADAFYFSKNQ